MAKNANIDIFWHIFCHFKPVKTTKTLSNYLLLAEEVQFGGSYVKIS